MIRIYIICEGRTETMFVNELLKEHFVHEGIDLIAKLIGRPGHQGGNIQFDRLYADLRKLLLGDSTAYCTTFFDFYGLHPDFPGKKNAQQKTVVSDKYMCIIDALTEKIKAELGESSWYRFIPYVQMHEFEGLLFSDPDGLARGIGQRDLASDFRTIRNGFDSPEAINDSPHTAPSKRIEKLFSPYDKPRHGPLAALEIGLETILAQCPLFNQWINHLKSLASP
ncbi:MAG: DUF4276 family protein [Magnetococcales bacterium]|nr:DUF4276 family protein [Magnetococcales bacterium]